MTNNMQSKYGKFRTLSYWLKAHRFSCIHMQQCIKIYLYVTCCIAQHFYEIESQHNYMQKGVYINHMNIPSSK